MFLDHLILLEFIFRNLNEKDETLNPTPQKIEPSNQSDFIKILKPQTQFCSKPHFENSIFFDIKLQNRLYLTKSILSVNVTKNRILKMDPGVSKWDLRFENHIQKVKP